ncbi:MAG TPA: prepilin-type N-terminal cleavage/methylation domain-containing protein [Patescibacteria group bacterium]|nr:prepilin-type N-terminal cleavage/methylation domain-containing protein [Patescibacteria group bacterium]
MIGNSKLISKLRHRQTGFSLMEIIVVLGIFSLLLVVVVNIYLIALKTQRQTSLRQETLSQLRYVAETMVRNIRASEIDYTYSFNQDGDDGIYGSEKELALIDEGGRKIIYFYDQGEIRISIDGQISALTDLDQVKILKFYFFIQPAKNPFLEEQCNDALVPSNCLATAIPPVSCTVNDLELGLTGFCQCVNDSQCASGFCDPESNLCLPPNFQPRVTIVLAFQSAGIRPEDIKTIYLQTSASSRVYKR